jgi:WD40 repeat protein
MNVTHPKIVTSFYVVGGTVRRDAPCYVERQADTDLYEGLKQGQFCYVLTARQMGKSSLMVRTAARLRDEGVGVAVLDLTAIGQNLSAEQWYGGLLTQLGQQLDLEEELSQFRREQEKLGPLQRCMQAIQHVVLPRYVCPVVIFVDEIDTVRSLPFSTDEFFAGIREFYNQRAQDRESERLTFCLLGVASPSDLIRDTRMTPFNIGRRIELHDFTEAEAMTLAQGLREEEGTRLLKRVLYWTGGHPYLTQRLCQAVADADESAGSGNPVWVDQSCAALFFDSRSKERDDNLLFVREQLLRSDVDVASLLSLYGSVSTGERVMDDETNPLVSVLLLSGITRLAEGRLRVRNRIYERVFDQKWIAANMPDAEVRRQRAAYRKGILRAGTIAAVVLAIVTALAFTAIKQRNRAQEQRNRAAGQENANRRLLYTAQMNLFAQDWEVGNIGRIKESLEAHLPKPGQEDLRGFEWYYIWRLCHSEIFTLRHKGAVDSVAFSPDGKTLISVNLDGGVVKTWDATTGKELSNVAIDFKRENQNPQAFSPDCKLLASISDSERGVRLWDVATGRVLVSLKGHEDLVSSVAFSPDGKTIASGGEDGTLKLWNISTGKEVFTLKAHQSNVITMRFSPDGKSLASGGADRTLKLWDVATARELITLKGHSRGVLHVNFSPDGRKLASSGWDGLRLWDLAKGRELGQLKRHGGLPLVVTFSPDGKRLASGGTDSTVTLWDVTARQELFTLKGHTHEIWALVFSPDGKRLVSGSADGTVKAWDLFAKPEPATLKGHSKGIASVVFSPDGKILASASADKTVKLWDVPTGLELATLQSHTELAVSLAFAPDGKTLGLGRYDGSLVRWDVATGQEMTSLKGEFFSMAFSPDGKTLAAEGYDQVAKVWTAKILDVLTGRELHSLMAPNGIYFAQVAFSSDGKALVTGADNGISSTVKVFDLINGQVLKTFEGQVGTFVRPVFSPGAKWLALVGRNGSVKVLVLATGQEVNTLKGYGWETQVAFSPDAKRLATVNSTDAPKLWDVAEGRELITLNTTSGHCVAFSPDGKTLATGDSDGNVRLYRAATEQEVLARIKE